MITIILIIIYAISSAVMDNSRNFAATGKLRHLNPLFWNAEASWVNKWRNGNKEQGEKFFGSSTFLVWTTDAWHFFKVITIICLFLSPILHRPIMYFNIPDLYKGAFEFLLYMVIYGITFEISFRWLRNP